MIPSPTGLFPGGLVGAPAGAARRPGHLEGPGLPVPAVPLRAAVADRHGDRPRAPGSTALTLPLWYWSISDGVEGDLPCRRRFGRRSPWCRSGRRAGLGIPALGAVGRFYTAYAELLLGSNVDPAVTAQMSDLRDARSRIIEAADAERRRIERDLHDGAQQRLVALSLSLRMAEKRAAAATPDAAELVRRPARRRPRAEGAARPRARHPPGDPHQPRSRRRPARPGGPRLGPVEGRGPPAERLPDQVEAAVYFVVSECLANIGKHAQATGATVAVTPRTGTCS